LKITRWSELAGYLRWGTLGLMTLAFGAFTSVLTNGATGGFIAVIGSFTMASVGAALVAPSFVGLAALAIASAGSACI